MDFGYWVMHGHGISREKIEAVPHWRDSELFDPIECGVRGPERMTQDDESLAEPFRPRRDATHRRR